MKFREVFLAALLSSLLVCASLGGQRASAAAGGSFRILLVSNRDGEERVYSVGADGAPLAPLLQPRKGLQPVAVSRDGSTIAYFGGKYAPESGPLFVSRASGAALRRLARGSVDEVSFSPNGKLLAFAKNSGIWVVGTNGRGLRRLTKGANDQSLDWSPTGRALVFMRVLKGTDDHFALVVKPLHGKARVLVRTGPNEDDLAYGYQPQWSPDGRWIAYINLENKEKRNGLTLVQPNGKRRHRATIGASEDDTFEWSPTGSWISYLNAADLYSIRPNGDWRKVSKGVDGPAAWSPDGRSLAFTLFGSAGGEDVAIAAADGRGLKKLNLALGHVWDQMWSLDGRSIAVAADGQIWIVGSDGQGLRRLTNQGENTLVGWTRLSPVLPPAAPIPPSERVIASDTVATDASVSALSADGSRVAFATGASTTDCNHVAVWAPGQGSTQRFGLQAPCRFGGIPITDVELAGSRAAWVAYNAQGAECGFYLSTATVSDPRPVQLGSLDYGEYGDWCKSPDYFHLRGEGDLLLFDSHALGGPSRLLRIGSGSESCGGDYEAKICATLRRDAQVLPLDSVSGGLIATRRPGSVDVLDATGKLVRPFTFGPADVSAARLDGTRLVVSRSYTVESYDVATGALQVSRQLPVGYTLGDVDGGIAVLGRADTAILLRLSDGASFTLSPGQKPVLADLESPGLFYSYATADGGRLVLLSRAEIDRRLSGSS